MITTIRKKCLICGKTFYPRLADVKRDYGKVCSILCRQKNQSIIMRGRKMKPETKKKLIKALTGKIRTKSQCENISNAHKGKFLNEDNPNWRGGKYKSQGRWYIRTTNHPFRHKNGYMLQSRFLVETIIGRYLTKKERVHHINFKKDDDRIENLYLFSSNKEHIQYHKLSIINLNPLKFGKAKPITKSNLLSIKFSKNK